MRSFILSFVLFLTLCLSVAQGKFLSLNEIGEASCRVRVSGSAGSGTSIAADDTHVYILTNAHVVGSNRTATCEFFRYGRKTQRLPGAIIWKSHSDRSVKDFAIIRIEKSLFGEFPPRIVPLAPADHVVQKNDYIASAGCPQARWLQLWEGHALSEASKNRVLFTPPPLGGQSGSGVYTVIDGDTYLCAVLTWRIENSKGGAIHIGNFLRAVKGEASYDSTQVPDSWQYANASTNTDTANIITRKAYYALGVNGVYYLQNWDHTGWLQSVTFPAGSPSVPIAQWGILMEVQCPGGRCPPFISPPNNNTPPKENPAPENDGDNTNPYGVLPPNFGKDFVPEANKKLQEYKDTIEKLKNDIGGLAKQVEDLTTSVSEKDGTIEVLVKEKESLSTTISEKQELLEKLQNQLKSLKSNENLNNDEILYLQKRIGTLQNDITTQLGEISNLKEDLDSKSNIIDGLANENYNLEQDTIEVKQQRNLFRWLFGGTATGALAWIAGLYWQLRGKTKVTDMIDGIWEDDIPPTSQDNDPSATEPEPTKPTHTADLRGLADYLEDRLGSAFESKIDNLKKEIDHKFHNLQTATKDIDFNIYNTIDDKDHIKVSHSTPKKETRRSQPDAKEDCDCDRVLDCIQEPSFPKASDRIKDFVDLKKSDGERVEELAFYAHLYKEAVELLKRDRLIVLKKSVPFKVSSQTKAADAIESYVQNQFLKRVSSATINRHILYHEAMIGFLYKQAISRLKRGEFNVLGYKEVAESIEQWVKTEFMRRMGFEF